MSAPEPGVVAVEGGVVLRARGLHKSFAAGGEERRVLTGLDLTVARGEIVAVAGRSGSGKTTLLSILAGWERPDAGEVSLVGGGAALADAPWPALALLPQTLGLLDELTVGENVTLPLRLGGPASSAAAPAGTGARGADDVADVAGGGGRPGSAGGVQRDGEGDVERLLARLGIDHLAGRYPSEVSLGEQQRAALARAAVVRPAVLLADEPIAHQNVAWAETMMAALRELADAGTTCVLATHNEVAFTVADRVLETHEGRLRPRAGA